MLQVQFFRNYFCRLSRLVQVTLQTKIYIDSLLNVNKFANKFAKKRLSWTHSKWNTEGLSNFDWINLAPPWKNANRTLFGERNVKIIRAIFSIFTRSPVDISIASVTALNDSTWKSTFSSVTQDAHGESDACRRNETVETDRPSKSTRESICARGSFSSRREDLTSSLGEKWWT